MKLYEISDAFAELLDNEELTEEQITEQLKNLQMELDEKVQNGIGLIKNLTATVDAMKNEESRLKQRRATIEKRIERIKAYYQHTLTAMNLKRVVTSRGAMTIAKVGGKPSIKYDESLIPKDFYNQRIVYELDKEKIRTALESGAEVQGAYLEERGSYLKIS